jgi:hypothetical protein
MTRDTPNIDKIARVIDPQAMGLAHKTRATRCRFDGRDKGSNSRCSSKGGKQYWRSKSSNCGSTDSIASRFTPAARFCPTPPDLSRGVRGGADDDSKPHSTAQQQESIMPTSRRNFLTTAAGIAAGGTALALAVVPAGAVSGSLTDGELSKALDDFVEMEDAIEALHKKHGDDADSREDYLKCQDMRDDAVETLISVPASSMDGIKAKASALQLQVLFEDYESHQAIALSLAEDLTALG